MNQHEYRVRIEIDVEAANAVAAAKAAYAMLRAPDCIPWLCEVFAESIPSRPVDLDVELDPNRSDLPVDEPSVIPTNRQRYHTED